MEKKEFEIMFNLEDDYWWYIALRELVFSMIDKTFPEKKEIRILDAGCGSGGTLARCSSSKAYGFDISEEAIKFCKKRNLGNIIKASVCNIPFPDNTFDLIISLDVLCNIRAEKEMTVLKEFYRVLDRDGILVLNLPAFNFLQSSHDRAVHIQHRYTRKDLREKIESSGFSIHKLTYRNSMLFPFIIVLRLLKKMTAKDSVIVKSDLRPLPGLMNRFLTGLLSLENKLILASFNFPFGLSLFSVARK